ncbi:MAG: 1-acyl-sn-glycerol-3-phosphate acyltransferase [Clostridiales bacterium]|nr:1-acyl-sn-glycerol-3-phosphate acyltransferase [Clostridiales bacterium]
MIRFILVASFVILFLILSIPLLIIEWIIGKFNMDLKNRSSLSIVNWAFRCCLFLAGVSTTILGEENVPKDRSVLYVANHRSYFDILLTYTRVPRPTGYVAKKGMLHVPLLADWMKNLHCLFLDRENIKEGLKTILTGVDKVKSGISICIFPEGTRNETDKPLLPFHAGSFKIAEKADCPVVPIAINNSADIWEAHLPRMKKTHVVVEYGKPIFLTELSREERKKLPKLAEEQIAAMYEKNQSLV